MEISAKLDQIDDFASISFNYRSSCKWTGLPINPKSPFCLLFVLSFILSRALACFGCLRWRQISDEIMSCQNGFTIFSRFISPKAIWRPKRARFKVKTGWNVNYRKVVYEVWLSCKYFRYIFIICTTSFILVSWRPICICSFGPQKA